MKRYFVEFNGPADEDLVRCLGGIVKHNFGAVSELLSAELPEEAVATLKALPEIKDVRPCARGVSVGQIVDSWYTQTTVNLAYRGDYTGQGIKVGLVDSGVAVHEDLPLVSGWVDFVNSQSSQYDDLSHGTFCAGLIAAQDNNLGYIGAAPDVQIYAAKVLDSQNRGWADDFIAGIDWAIAQGVDIINFSIVTEAYDQYMVAATRRAFNAGIIVVACSGNGTFTMQNGWDNVGIDGVYCPAVDYSCVAVGSIDVNEVRSFFSNYGTGLNIVAPGGACYSTVPSGYTNGLGTSFATAMVTGHLAALAEKTGLRGQSLVNRLYLSTLDLMDLNQFGHGLVRGELTYPGLPSAAVSVVSRTEGGFNLSWGTASNATYYLLAYCPAYLDDNDNIPDYNWLYQYFPNNSGSIQYGSISGLQYGVTYKFAVRAANSNGTSSWKRDISGVATTVPYTPTISVGNKTTSSITIDVSAMPGNWSYVRVHCYKGGVYQGYEDIAYGYSSATFTGLDSGTLYGFVAVSVLTINGVDLQSVNDSNSLGTGTLGTKPSGTFNWTNTIASGKPATNLTAIDWNLFTSRINAFLNYKGYASISFTQAVQGNNFTASMFNQARNAIYDNLRTFIDPIYTLTGTKSSGQALYADYLENLRICLESIS